MCYITQCPYPWHQTLYVYVIFTLYGIRHSVRPQNHCVPSQPLCVILDSMYFWHYTQCTNFLRRSKCMSSESLYVWHHMHTYDITSTLYDFTQFKLSRYIHCTHAIIHPIYDITHMAIRTLYLPSVPLYLTLHPLFLCHQTQSISYTTPTLCMTSQTIHVTSYSVCMLSEQLFKTLHTSMYNFTPSIFLTSYPICTLST